MTIYNFNTDILERYFNGRYSAEDREYVRKLFCGSENQDELEHLIRKKYYELINDSESEDKNLDHILYRIHYELNTKEKKSVFRRSINNIFKWSARVAAILILPLLIYSSLQFYRESMRNPTWVEIKAPAWTRVQFSLPDGSTGWLNSSSSIRYNNNFIDAREIHLEGEAYFDVSTDPERPFKVSTDEIIVTAYGTKFNVASYENERDVEVVLEEGTVMLSNRQMTRSYTMKPDDLVIYDKATDQINTKAVQSETYIAWREGKLVFRNDPIDVIARRLGRWYNVDVEIRGNNFTDVRLRATFVDENLNEVLYFLKRTLPVNYKIMQGKFQTHDETFAKKKIVFTTIN